MTIDHLLDRLIEQSRGMLVAIENEEWDQLIAARHGTGDNVQHTSKLQELEVLENTILTACIKERQNCQSALTDMKRQAKAANSYLNCNSL